MDELKEKGLRSTTALPVLAHVLVGEPDPTSPGHVLAAISRFTLFSDAHADTLPRMNRLP